MKRIFFLQMGPPPREVCLGARRLGDAGVIPGKSKFRFPKGPLPSREVCLGARSHQHAGVSLGEEESLMEIKFLFTKAHPGVTKDLAPRQTSRGGGPFGNRNFLLPGMTPASPRRLAPRQTSRGGGPIGK